MERVSKRITVPCDCGCCDLVFEKSVWGDGSVSYDVSVEDSYYDSCPNSLPWRLRRALGILFGKPVPFNDVCIDREDRFASMLAKLGALYTWDPSEEEE